MGSHSEMGLSWGDPQKSSLTKAFPWSLEAALATNTKQHPRAPVMGFFLLDIIGDQPSTGTQEMRF